MAFPYLTDVLRAVGIDMPLPIPLFGLFVGIAFLTGQWIAKIEAKRLVPTLPPDFTTNACLYSFLAGIVGARLFHLLEYPREFLANPGAFLFTTGGFTIFGGLIAGTLTAAWYSRRNRAPIPLMLDVAAPGLMIAYAIGRIGCQISGDGDWGIAVTSAAPAWLPDWLWAQTYDGNIAGVAIPPPGVYPTPIYESLMSFVAFAVLWKLRRHAHAPGWLFGVYLLLAGIERLLIEFIRVNTYYVLFGVEVTQAQLIAAACVIAGIVVMWRRRAPARAVPAPV
jgi:phosphatidylglycerol:prolipoprotein diacylglycerol transferase